MKEIHYKLIIATLIKLLVIWKQKYLKNIILNKTMYFVE